MVRAARAAWTASTSTPGEGYATDELDFSREHFAAAQTPLVYSPEEHRPAIFRGLIAYEYVRGIERDMHPAGKLMMANGAPDRLWWLAPMLDVLGTETDWLPQDAAWQPMPDAELLYRRAMSKGKPFCFLMNTRFENFSHELVEKYMKRCLAYGMFPGVLQRECGRRALLHQARVVQSGSGPLPSLLALVQADGGGRLGADHAGPHGQRSCLRGAIWRPLLDRFQR